jgi:phosphoribosylamine--glycine ligase
MERAGLGRGEQARIYFGDVSEGPDGVLHLGGSRTAGIVGIGDTLAEAEKIAEKLCEKVKGPVRFRKDIGTAELMQKRVEMMRRLGR